uniref:Sulphate adenylyltransferase catalytic domain-containing protein n=1 Tax=Salix viminalis TaxID=40686 RepID=A0A6N2ML17_SALVM
MRKVVEDCCKFGRLSAPKEERIARTWGTTAPGLPYVEESIAGSGNWLIGGDLEVIEPIKYHDGLDHFRLSPAQLREEFTRRNADAVFAFQLRNPILADGFLRWDTRTHPFASSLGGYTKADDVPLSWRMKQHEKVLEDGVLDPETTVVSIFPSPMHYAGPTGAGMGHPVEKRDLYDADHGKKVLSMAPGLERLLHMTKTQGKMAFFDPSSMETSSSFLEKGHLQRTMRTLLMGSCAPVAGKCWSEYYDSFESGKGRQSPRCWNLRKNSEKKRKKQSTVEIRTEKTRSTAQNRYCSDQELGMDFSRNKNLRM